MSQGSPNPPKLFLLQPKTRSQTFSFSTKRSPNAELRSSQETCTHNTIKPPTRNARSAPALAFIPPQYSIYPKSSTYMPSDSEDDSHVVIRGHPAWTPPTATSKPVKSSLRTRLFGFGRQTKPKTICTAPGARGAGDTETETDEPSRHLPTARVVPSAGTSNTLEQRVTPFLFEASRLLSIVPAMFGICYNVYYVYQPPLPSDDRKYPPERVDYFVSTIWTLLTGWQCLCLTTGLLARWRVYYPPLPTLIRLLALQAICWPATHYTLKFLKHEIRPVIVWSVIGTTTSISRSVQIWVTSNLWWEKGETDTNGAAGRSDGKQDRSYLKKIGGKWGGRRWDWREILVNCVLPAGVVYFIQAWAEAIRRDPEWFSPRPC